MSVTALNPGHGQEVQTLWYEFSTEDEAHMFVLGVKDDMEYDDDAEFLEFVDYSVSETETGKWRAEVQFIDRTPLEFTDPPLAV